MLQGRQNAKERVKGVTLGLENHDDMDTSVDEDYDEDVMDDNGRNDDNGARGKLSGTL